MKTERLLLRRWTMEDAADLFEYAKNPNVGPNAGWKPHESVEESKEIIQMFLKGNEWALVDSEKNKVIGSIGIFKDSKRNYDTAYTFGYVLAEEYWGKGIMSEAVQAIIPYVFDELGATILSVMHFPFNKRSKRVIEKMGFHYEGVLRKSYQIYDGNCYDEYLYSMLKEEYEEWKKS